MLGIKEAGEYIKVSTLIAIIPILAFFDYRHVIASDFENHQQQHILSDIDWYEERVEDLQVQIIKLESLEEINVIDAAALSAYEHRVERYIRRIKTLRTGIEN